MLYLQMCAHFRDRENGTTSSWRSRVYNDTTLNPPSTTSKRLDGGQQSSASLSTSSPSSSAGRLQRQTIQESIEAVSSKLSAVKDIRYDANETSTSESNFVSLCSSGATSKYKNSYTNDVSATRPTTLRSRTTQVRHT
jgi:hypothetical protein